MWATTQDVFDWKQANGFTASQYYKSTMAHRTQLSPQDYGNHKIRCQFVRDSTSGTLVTWGSVNPGAADKEFQLRIAGTSIEFWYQDVTAVSTVTLESGVIYDVVCTWNNTTDTCTISVNNETPVVSSTGNGNLTSEPIAIGGRGISGGTDLHIDGIVLNWQLLTSSDVVVAEFIGNDGFDRRRKYYNYSSSTGLHRSSVLASAAPDNVMHLWEHNVNSPATVGVLVCQDDGSSDRSFLRYRAASLDRFGTWNSSQTFTGGVVTAGTYMEYGGVEGTTQFYGYDDASETTWSVSDINQSTQPIEIGGRTVENNQMGGNVGTYLMVDLDATSKTRAQIAEWFYNDRLGRDRWSISQQDITDYGIVYGSVNDGGGGRVNLDGLDGGDWYLTTSTTAPSVVTSRKNSIRDSEGTAHAYNELNTLYPAEYPAFNGTDCFGYTAKNPAGDYMLRSDQCKFSVSGGTSDNGNTNTYFGDRGTDGAALTNELTPLRNKIIDDSQDKVRKYVYEDLVTQAIYDQLI